jgi:hypothetical protein
MDVSELLKRCRLDFRALSDLSGVSLGYIKLLSSRNRMAGPDTRAKLAKGLRAHVAHVEQTIAELEAD